MEVKARFPIGQEVVVEYSVELLVALRDAVPGSGWLRTDRAIEISKNICGDRYCEAFAELQGAGLVARTFKHNGQRWVAAVTITGVSV